MDERAALYQSILDNPEDDTPRLVFADWLQENHEPSRATFIRQSIAQQESPDWTFHYALGEGAAIEMRPRSSVFSEGEPQDREYKYQAIPATREALSFIPHALFLAEPVPGVSLDVRRGFVDAISLTVTRFLDLGPGLFRQHPICRVHLVGPPGGNVVRHGRINRDDLPDWLFRLVVSQTGGDRLFEEEDSFIMIAEHDQKRAEEALSTACVTAARVHLRMQAIKFPSPYFPNR